MHATNQPGCLGQTERLSVGGDVGGQVVGRVVMAAALGVDQHSGFGHRIHPCVRTSRHVACIKSIERNKFAYHADGSTVTSGLTNVLMLSVVSGPSCFM